MAATARWRKPIKNISLKRNNQELMDVYTGWLVSVSVAISRFAKIILQDVINNLLECPGSRRIRSELQEDMINDNISGAAK